MPNNVKYTISIPAKETNLIKYIDEKRQHSNLSAYIRNLIQKDIDNSIDTELETIYDYVFKRLKEDDFLKLEKKGSKLESAIDNASKDIIMELF